MTALREAAQQALEAMSSFESGTNGLYEGEFAQEIAALKAALVEEALQRFTDVNQELEAALVEPVQEPVAYIHRQGRHWEVSERPLDQDEKARGWTEEPLYTAPPQRPAEPKQDGCDHCNHPMYVAIKCRVCGRVTEPVQEPYAWMSVGGSIWRHKTTEDDVPLYTAPRKPLAEWQINDLMSDIDPEDRDSWSFRQGVYAAEKHHGVRR